jgi:enoyl-[acyl-carrier-protein] reductase (NADH)
MTSTSAPPKCSVTHGQTIANVAELAVYLASDDAEMVTESMQVLDGGYTAG